MDNTITMTNLLQQRETVAFQHIHQPVEDLALQGPYSIGTQAAIANLIQQLSDKQNQYDVIFINACTLFRNRTDKSKGIDQIYRETLTEFKQIVIDVAAAHRANPVPLNITLVIYCPDYNVALPIGRHRPDSLTRSVTSQLASKMQAEIRKYKLDEFKNVDGVNFRYSQMLTKVPVHKVLFNITREAKSTGHVLMISHYPTDFHLCHMIKDFKLLETHTGAFKTKDDLGQKVFKIPEIPFLPITHALLGDSYAITSALSIAQKQQMIAQAKMEHWSTHTSEYVKAKLRSKGWDLSILPLLE